MSTETDKVKHKFQDLTVIEKNWNAIKFYEAEAKQITGDPEAGFNPTLFFLGVKQLVINCKYRGKKGKKGAEKFTQSYREISTRALFCPYTGKPLYEQSEEIAKNLTSKI